MSQPLSPRALPQFLPLLSDEPDGKVISHVYGGGKILGFFFSNVETD